MSRVSTSTITACKGVVSLAIRKRPALAEVIGANVGTDAEGDGDADGAVVEQGTEASRGESLQPGAALSRGRAEQTHAVKLICD